MKILLRTVLVLLGLLVFSACQSKSMRCDEIESILEKTDKVYISMCSDSSGKYYGLVNKDNTEILTPKYALIDDGIDDVSKILIGNEVTVSNLDYYRITLLNEKGIPKSGIFSKKDGLVLEAKYDNVFIVGNQAYYSNSEVHYIMHLDDQSIKEVDYFIAENVDGTYIFQYKDKLVFSTDVKDFSIDNIDAKVLYVDSDYYAIYNDSNLEIRTIDLNQIVYIIEDFYRFASYIVNHNGNLYIKENGSSLKVIHNVTTKSKRSFDVEFLKMKDGLITTRIDDDVFVYDMEFNKILEYRNITGTHYKNLITYIKDDTEYVTSPKSDITFKLPEKIIQYDGFYGFIFDGEMKLYDETLNLVASCTDSNLRWFTIEGKLILIKTKENQLQVQVDHYKIFEYNKENLNTFEYDDRLLISNINQEILYAEENEIIVLSIEVY